MTTTIHYHNDDDRRHHPQQPMCSNSIKKPAALRRDNNDISPKLSGRPMAKTRTTKSKIKIYVGGGGPIKTYLQSPQQQLQLLRPTILRRRQCRLIQESSNDAVAESPGPVMMSVVSNNKYDHSNCCHRRHRQQQHHRLRRGGVFRRWRPTTSMISIAVFCFTTMILWNNEIVVFVKADQVDEEITTSSAPSEEAVATFSPTDGGTMTMTTMPSSAPSEEEVTISPVAGPIETAAPVVSQPTDLPTDIPAALVPTTFPSDMPSSMPTDSFSPTINPTQSPTMSPTFRQLVTSSGQFSQRFDVGDGQLFSDDELGLIEGLYRSYTPQFAVPPGVVAAGLITTICDINSQVEVIPVVTDGGRRRRELAAAGRPSDLDEKLTIGKFDPPRLRRQKSFPSGSSSSTFTNTNSTKLNGILVPTRHNGNRTKHVQQRKIRTNRKRNRNRKKMLYDSTMSYSSSIQVQAKRRRLQNVEVIQLDYTMTYESKAINVTVYPVLFQNWVNTNLDTVTVQMQTLGLNVTQAQIANRVIPRTEAPTVSMFPSMAPSELPSMSPAPTIAPSLATEPPIPDSGSGNDAIIIGVSVAVALLLIGIAVMIWCRSRKQRRQMKYQSSSSMKQNAQQASGREQGYEGSGWDGQGDAAQASYHSNNNYYSSDNPDMLNSSYQQYEGQDQELAATPNQSFLSAGNPMGGGSVDGIEPDATQMLADEFDQYQDHDLERMRADVGGNLEGCDGMMNEAVARALIDVDDDLMDSEEASEYMWGCPIGSTGIQIEAGVLWYVMDWMKRNNKASVEEKRTFMQEILNKMVASVRKGYIGPDDASRTIHECGALLGVQLAAEMPSTTIAITGLRKNATAQDIQRAFSKFGQVVTAEVAPNQRGFGIIRFSADDSVNRAVQKYKTDGEVVVQDVGVQLKAIRPEIIAAGNGDATNGNGKIP
mmetsp:Transcript_56696/g.137871  ORF Transcript_56696/g.137871 Transcript_56696/m.137871 type:complete len:934 (-) Transcript_56696:228-3029(-)